MNNNFSAIGWSGIASSWMEHPVCGHVGDEKGLRLFLEVWIQLQCAILVGNILRSQFVLEDVILLSIISSCQEHLWELLGTLKVPNHSRYSLRNALGVVPDSADSSQQQAGDHSDFLAAAFTFGLETSTVLARCCHIHLHFQ